VSRVALPCPVGNELVGHGPLPSDTVNPTGRPCGGNPSYACFVWKPNGDTSGKGSTTNIYRNQLPQLDAVIFLTDGGIETTLIFDDGIDLPDFAAFPLLATADGRTALARYFRRYADLAEELGVGVVLESATWRASADWGARLGYSDAQLADTNREAIDMLTAIRSSVSVPVVVSGCIGSRGDGYDPGQVMTVDQACAYHSMQVRSFASSDADMVSGITMTNVPEAIGLATSAADSNIPVALSFTVETDGALPLPQRHVGKQPHCSLGRVNEWSGVSHFGVRLVVGCFAAVTAPAPHSTLYLLCACSHTAEVATSCLALAGSFRSGTAHNVRKRAA
jgi:hypothetical protein